jgi:hypothetical protein
LSISWVSCLSVPQLPRVAIPIAFFLLFVNTIARYAIMIPKGYRPSFSHLVFYVSTIIITTQLWSIWRQTDHSYLTIGTFIPSKFGDWQFNADVHANIHTLNHEQCDSAFPDLYHSLDQAVRLRQGRKVHIQDIEIREGRCMLRVMIHGGEVNPTTPSLSLGQSLT